MRYLETKHATDEFTRRIDSEVTLVRQNREWMVEYMKTLVHDMDVTFLKQWNKLSAKVSSIEQFMEKII